MQELSLTLRDRLKELMEKAKIYLDTLKQNIQQCKKNISEAGELIRQMQEDCHISNGKPLSYWVEASKSISEDQDYGAIHDIDEKNKEINNAIESRNNHVEVLGVDTKGRNDYELNKNIIPLDKDIEFYENESNRIKIQIKKDIVRVGNIKSKAEIDLNKLMQLYDEYIVHCIEDLRMVNHFAKMRQLEWLKVAEKLNKKSLIEDGITFEEINDRHKEMEEINEKTKK